MRRAAFILVGAAVGALAATLAWWWWTAPPLSDAEALAAAATDVQKDADGLLAVAEPRRAARWLLRRPQAVALLAVAAPDARPAFERLRNTLATLAAEARGPLTVWWKGPEAAASARVSDGAAGALRRLAALEGLSSRSVPTRSGGPTVTLATSSALLEGPSGGRPALDGPARLSGIARAGARWWRVRAARESLELLAGAVPELPPSAGPSTIVTQDLGRLVGIVPASVSAPRFAAALAFTRDGWALTLPGAEVGPGFARLLNLGGDRPAETPPGARRWRGLLGEVWALPADGLAIASGPAMLASLPSRPLEGEWGTVRGEELAVACLRAAEAIETLRVLGPRAAALRRSAPAAAAIRSARWRIVSAGGAITLEW